MDFEDYYLLIKTVFFTSRYAYSAICLKSGLTTIAKSAAMMSRFPAATVLLFGARTV